MTKTLEFVPPILNSLTANYVKENCDPCDSYVFGSPWRKKKRH